jgi:hypothetical protein
MLLSIVFIIGNGSPQAQEEETDVKGRIPFDFPNAPESKIEINLNKKLISVFSAAADIGEKTNELFEMLDGVYVRGYTNEVANLDEMIRYYEATLKKQEWEVIAKIKEEHEAVHIRVLFDLSGEIVHGVFVMIAEEEQTILVNIFGQIDPEKVGELVRHLAEAFNLEW